jgi:hypothetical protein
VALLATFFSVRLFHLALNFLLVLDEVDLAYQGGEVLDCDLAFGVELIAAGNFIEPTKVRWLFWHFSDSNGMRPTEGNLTTPELC